MSSGNTSKETSGTGADADNETNCGKEINSDANALTRPCGEKYGTIRRM